MHVTPDLVPGYDNARPVRTENGIHGLLQVGCRIVSLLKDDFLRVPAGLIIFEGIGDPALTVRVGTDSCSIVADPGRGDGAGENSGPSVAADRVKAAVHALNIGHKPADRLLGDLGLEAVPGLQQDAFGGHQTLTKRTYRRLPEIASFGMLLGCPAPGQRDLHIGNHRSCQDSARFHGHERGQDEALPVQRQAVRADTGVILDPGPAPGGFEEHMYLRIVPERLVVTNALHRRGDSFTIDDRRGSESDMHSVPLQAEIRDDLGLHLPHDIGGDLPGPAVAADRQHGFFFFQGPQVFQRFHRICIFVENNLASQDRHDQAFSAILPGRRRRPRKSQHLTCAHVFQPDGADDPARFRFAQRFEGRA